MSKVPNVVEKLKTKLEDAYVDSSTVLKTVLKLSSLWVGPEFPAPQISVPGTQTASWSMWAELSYNCGVCLNVHRPVLPPLPHPPFSVLVSASYIPCSGKQPPQGT